MCLKSPLKLLIESYTMDINCKKKKKLGCVRLFRPTVSFLYFDSRHFQLPLLRDRRLDLGFNLKLTHDRYFNKDTREFKRIQYTIFVAEKNFRKLQITE